MGSRAPIARIGAAALTTDAFRRRVGAIRLVPAAPGAAGHPAFITAGGCQVALSIGSSAGGCVLGQYSRMTI